MHLLAFVVNNVEHRTVYHEHFCLLNTVCFRLQCMLTKQQKLSKLIEQLFTQISYANSSRLSTRVLPGACWNRVEFFFKEIKNYLYSV